MLNPSGDQSHVCINATTLVAGHCVQCALAVEQLHPAAGFVRGGISCSCIYWTAWLHVLLAACAGVCLCACCTAGRWFAAAALLLSLEEAMQSIPGVYRAAVVLLCAVTVLKFMPGFGCWVAGFMLV